MSDDAGGPICGIDLGTTFSSIGFLNAFGRAEVIPTLDGMRCIPSVVLFPPEGGAPLVGREAKERSAEHPDRVVEFVKREMGDPDWRFDVDGASLSPPAVSALILKMLVQLAHDRLGERPRSAVITCPAYFGDLERQATADAGAIAGLDVLSTFNEPTAAALAFGLHQAAKSERVRAMVYDLGGGTFDVTVLELEQRAVRVLATAGEHRLGGKDWDDELVNHVAEQFVGRWKKDPREELGAQQDLRNRCEAAKVSLSTKERAVVFCRAYGETLKVELTRGRFEELTRPLLLQTKTYVDQVLAAANVGWKDIHVVLPVGGSSHMPQVRQLLHAASGRAPETVVDPDLAVVQGATYYAALMRSQQGFAIEVLTERPPAPAPPPPPKPAARPSSSSSGRLPPPRKPSPFGEDEDLPALPGLVSLDAAPELLSLPGQVADEPVAALPGQVARPVFAVPKAAPPAPPRALVESREFDGFGWPGDMTRTVVYDFGDLVGGALKDSKESIVRNVNSRSLAVLTYSQGQKKASVMIRQNSPLPAMHRNRFFTVNDNQTAVKVVVLEGESADPEACVRIGECLITGLPPRPKGQEVEIVYTYDQDGRLAILARDVRSGVSAEVELRRASAMSDGQRDEQRAALEALGG